METRKVSAVVRMAAERDHYRRHGQWTLQFLDILLREFEHGHEGEPSSGRPPQEDGAEDGEEDCRIVRGGEGEVPIDWDSLEISDEEEPILHSEPYHDIIDSVRCVGNWKADVLYKIADAVMRDYYSGAFDECAVSELFYACYQKCVEKDRKLAESEELQSDILRTLYEYFSRVNARWSVARNEREGRGLVEQAGLGWTGTTYYNSAYYYTCEQIQWLFRRLCDHIAVERRLRAVPFARVEERTQFAYVGGLTFHGVFVWMQQKDNHPANQYGMKELERIPPERFVYLYRNHFARGEESGIRLLEQQMHMAQKQEKGCLWRSFTLGEGREYHNGMSYLLEGSLEDEQDDAAYGAAMGFLQNFRLYRRSGCVEFLSAG